MSAYGMHPTFGDLDGYRSWIKAWKVINRRLTSDIRKSRLLTKAAQRSEDPEKGKAQVSLFQKRVMARKMMTLLKDARVRRNRIIQMQKSLDEQFALQPIIETDCRTVDFHFNKGSLEFPFLPEWVIKTKGRSFYVHDVEAQVPWTTRNLDKGSTKGMIRLRNCQVRIEDGKAIISA